MSVLPINSAGESASRSAKSHELWQRLAHMLDRLVVSRTKRAVPESVLRRSKHDIDRCRRLMHDRSAGAADIGTNRVSPRRTAHVMQVR
jgi:hypothetical protein